jgi:uncharacterized protein (TIGR00297 family)
MSLRILVSRFCQTSNPSGIVLVGIQAAALYVGFGIAAPLVLMTVAITGTAASMLRNARYSKKERPDSPRDWRNAAANAGIATVLALVANMRIGHPYKASLAIVATSTLCATLSDTLSHEIGVMFGGVPRLVTTWRKARPGDNGAVTVLGSLVAVATSFGLAFWASALGLVSPHDVVRIGVASCAGNIVDSLLGATFEDRFRLSNNLINFCCVSSAAVVAVLLLRRG